MTRLALSPFANGGWNSRILLLFASATHRFPEESTATSDGKFIVDCVVPGALEVKLDCPNTTFALCPMLKGGLNSRTLSLPWSLTQRFPDESKAMPDAPPRPDWLVDGAFEVKFACPITTVAFIP